MADVVFPDGHFAFQVAGTVQKVLPDGLAFLVLGQAGLHPFIGLLDLLLDLFNLTGKMFVLPPGDQILLLLLPQGVLVFFQRQQPQGHFQCLFSLR